LIGCADMERRFRLRERTSENGRVHEEHQRSATAPLQDTKTATFTSSCLAGRMKAICDMSHMTQGTREILRRVGHWPQEDQDELAEVAREIEARRTGVYVLSDDERVALDEARESGIASEEEVSAFWKGMAVDEGTLPQPGTLRSGRDLSVGAASDAEKQSGLVLLAAGAAVESRLNPSEPSTFSSSALIYR
jgi:hypothetical protein